MSALSSNTKYYKEAHNLFSQCSKNEDRQDLANKFYEEASDSSTDTTKIVQACPREFEELLPFVTSSPIIGAFFDRLTQNDLDIVIRGRSTCFFLEKLLNRLPNLLAVENEHIRSGYDRLFQCVTEHFDEYIKETGPSHILAGAISFLHPAIQSTDGNDYEQLIDAGRTPKRFVELSSDWQAMDKLRLIGKLVKDSSDHNEFVYATLLRTAGYLRPKLYEKLVERLFSKQFSDLTIEHVLDKHSSFIFEVLLEFPSERRDSTIYPLVFDHLDQLYLHPIGNFFLQHLLLTVNQKDRIDQVYQFLIDDERFEKLLLEGHIRLIVTFIRICERFRCHYDELIHRVKRTVSATKNDIKDFIPSLFQFRAGKRDIGCVTRDPHCLPLANINAETQLITKDGSLLVQALLRADQIDSLTRQSFLSLTGEQIAAIACHPSGSHVLCQMILKSSLWPGLRQKNFYDKLVPFYTRMACDKAACWFVTQLWKSATHIDHKLHMARSMAKDLATLRSHTYAKFITYEMNLIAYCSRAEQWQWNIELILKKHALFDDLESDEQTEKKKKKRR